MMWCLCTSGYDVVVMYLSQWCRGYVLVAMILWLCTCSNGVVVMYLYKLCGGYVLVAMLWWLCACIKGVELRTWINGVLVMYL